MARAGAEPESAIASAEEMAAALGNRLRRAECAAMRVGLELRRELAAEGAVRLGEARARGERLGAPDAACESGERRAPRERRPLAFEEDRGGEAHHRHPRHFIVRDVPGSR